MLEDWGDWFRRSFTYDDAGNLDEMLFEKWNHFLEQWQGRWLDQFTFDETNTLTERLTVRWYFFLEDWVNFRLMTLVIDYKNVLSGIDNPYDQDGSIIMNFQNPYTGQGPVMFEGLATGLTYQMTIYSIAGRQVFNQAVYEGEPVNLDGSLNNGFYLMNVTLGDKVLATEKIIISR